MNTYLSDENIKVLKQYLKTHLPPKTRAILLNLKLKTGLELYYDTKTNTQLLWQFILNEIRSNNDTVTAEYNKLAITNDVYAISDLVFKYISKHYAEEWQVVNNLNNNPAYVDGRLQTTIIDYLSNFAQYYKVSPLTIKECVECSSFDELLERYSIKNIDKDVYKKTEAFAKAIDIFYKDVQYNTPEYKKMRFATEMYLKNKDIQELHNLINT
jgi:hypothetical protein